MQFNILHVTGAVQALGVEPLDVKQMIWKGLVSSLIGEKFCYLLISIFCFLSALIRHLNVRLPRLDDDEYDALLAIQAGNLYANLAFEMRWFGLVHLKEDHI